MRTTSRRELIRAVGAGALGLLAAACGPAAQPSPTAPGAKPTLPPSGQAEAPDSSQAQKAAQATTAPAPTTPPKPTEAPKPAAATAPAVPKPAVSVKVTDIQITSAAGTYIADAKGYFREEGIQAEFLAMAGADQVPAVVSATADVAGAAINAALYNALARGMPLRMVADHGANLQNASAGGWAVRKDLVESGKYKGPADVRGWKIAVGTPSSTADISLDRFLNQGGLSLVTSTPSRPRSSATRWSPLPTR